MTWFIYQPQTEPVVFTAEVITEDKYHFPWSEPVRIKPRINVALQQFLAYSESAQFPETVTESRWHQPWSEPVRFKPRLITADNPFIIPELLPPAAFSMAWFNWLAEPVRLPIGLRKEFQRDTFFNTFIPIQYTSGLQVTEQGDFLTAVFNQFAPPEKAIVTVVAPPVPPGYSALLTPNLPPVPGARVAIIVTPGL